MISIELCNITKRFGELTAVSDLSLRIEKGELFFLLGPSGCGKTTVLRLIAGFIESDGGKIMFDDQDITASAPHKRKAAMVFQNYALWPHMTVLENVSYGLEIKGVPRRERKQRALNALEMVRMTGYEGHFPHELSGGQQQRIAVARALVVEPDVLLMDEPLSNLDARLRLEMRREIRRIHRETKHTIVYVTHDQAEALSLADNIAVLNRGVLQQVGRPQELYNRPRNAFVAKFIGDINILTGKVVQLDPVVVRTEIADFRTALREPCKLDEQVLCCFRPESVSTNSKGSDSTNTFRAVVETQAFTGEVIHYELSVRKGCKINVCSLSSQVNLSDMEKELSVSVSPEKIMILRQE